MPPLASFVYILKNKRVLIVSTITRYDFKQFDRFSVKIFNKHEIQNDTIGHDTYDTHPYSRLSFLNTQIFKLFLLEKKM